MSEWINKQFERTFGFNLNARKTCNCCGDDARVSEREISRDSIFSKCDTLNRVSAFVASHVAMLKKCAGGNRRRRRRRQGGKSRAKQLTTYRSIAGSRNSGSSFCCSLESIKMILSNTLKDNRQLTTGRKCSFLPPCTPHHIIDF